METSLGTRKSEIRQWPLREAGRQALVEEINRLKRERGAVILAHNYQAPEIFHGVADLRGDSLALAREAAESDAEVIVVCGVHFMAETAKLLNPSRTVLIPDPEAGCSLADSITADDVRRLKATHPGVPVVTYVNTSAAVKAETDVCCTSANAVDVVESLGSDRVLFLPDRHLARWVEANTAVEIIPWTGSCEVHEQFTAAQVAAWRAERPGLFVVAHPECPLEVLQVVDAVGSTAGMIRHVTNLGSGDAVLVTESSMTDNLREQLPEVDLLRPDIACPHMQRITLEKILASLELGRYEVEVDEVVARGARRSVERMLELA